MKDPQVTIVNLKKKKKTFYKCVDISSLVTCDPLKFCCESGVPGGQKCKGRCISQHYLNDGKRDCDNGADEGFKGNYILHVIFFFVVFVFQKYFSIRDTPKIFFPV